MSRVELLRILSVYRRSREQLVAALVSEAPELYHAMFAFKPSSVAMSVALERYVFLWLIRHPAVYRELYLSQGEYGLEDEQQLFARFMERYYEYCKCFLSRTDSERNPSSDAIDSNVMEVLLRHKMAFLDELLRTSQKADVRLQWLRYQHTKAKALFDRELVELRRHQHGTRNTR